MEPADPVALREKAAHFRHLAQEISDRHAAQALSRRADELEAEAAELEVGKSNDTGG